MHNEHLPPIEASIENQELWEPKWVTQTVDAVIGEWVQVRRKEIETRLRSVEAQAKLTKNQWAEWNLCKPRDHVVKHTGQITDQCAHKYSKVWKESAQYARAESQKWKSRNSLQNSGLAHAQVRYFDAKADEATANAEAWIELGKEAVAKWRIQDCCQNRGKALSSTRKYMVKMENARANVKGWALLVQQALDAVPRRYEEAANAYVQMELWTKEGARALANALIWEEKLLEVDNDHRHWFQMAEAANVAVGQWIERARQALGDAKTWHVKLEAAKAKEDAFLRKALAELDKEYALIK